MEVWAGMKTPSTLNARSAALLLLALAATSCVPRQPPEPPAPPPLPPPKVLYEEVIAPVERPALSITDIVETPSPDRRSVTVSGTLINRGTGATHDVSVQVEALNADGAVVLSTAATPTTQHIAPGTTAEFSATFDTRPDVDRYHVEAISR